MAGWAGAWSGLWPGKWFGATTESEPAPDPEDTVFFGLADGSSLAVANVARKARHEAEIDDELVAILVAAVL